MNKVMSWKKLAFLFGMMLIAFFYVNGQLAGRQEEAAAQNNAVQLEIARLQRENSELKQAISQKDTKQSIESTAREYHQYMHQDEVAFEFDHPERLYLYTDEELKIYQEETNSP